MLRQKVLSHLEQYCSKEALLLGLSGGPDSTALFYLLTDLNHPFEVAHYDHGWRIESANERKALEKLCTHFSVPFHAEVAHFKPDKNCEDKARKARHAFFRKILESRNLKGVALGHHADDQAETVLKRIFEGARLTNLKGLQPVVNIEGLKLHRPLLSVKKNEILNWLEENHITFFEDPTNFDESNLRSRMRTQILPALSKFFGKEISSNLTKLARDISELDQFVSAFLEEEKKYFLKKERGGEFSLERLISNPAFLRPFIVKAFFDFFYLSISDFVVKEICDHALKKSKKKRINLKYGALFFDFPYLRFVLKQVDEESIGEYDKLHSMCD
jgi:tRNA(Ile)-lysidine synthase